MNENKLWIKKGPNKDMKNTLMKEICKRSTGGLMVHKEGYPTCKHVHREKVVVEEEETKGKTRKGTS